MCPTNVLHPARIAPLALALCFASSGCITTSQEAKLGEEEAKKVEEQMGFVDDAKLHALVREIASKLVALSERADGKWEFHVVDSAEPNAFALPGGYVYVTRGLLTLVNSEDELAGVIGHEMGHVTARHTSKRIGAAILTAPVAIATGIAGAAVGIVAPVLGGLVAGTGQVFSQGLVIAPFSREQEREADEIGQALAARAGYDPAGITHFLHTLDRAVTMTSGEERKFTIFDSHPLTPERVAATRELAATLTRASGQPVTKDRADLLARFDGILVGDDPAGGVFEENLFLHPVFDFALEFPKDWKMANTDAAVGAVSPGEDAVVALQIAKMKSTLDEVIKEAQEEQRGLEFERSKVEGLPTARTRVDSRGNYADITLIEYKGDVYGLVGKSASRAADAYARIFESTARSFRALRSSERNGIQETRLRIRKAQSGESPAAIVDRTKSTWTAEFLAMANALDGTTFESGTAVKVPISQPYKSR